MPPHDRNESQLDRRPLRSIARASDTGSALAFIVVSASLALQAINLALPVGASRTPVPIALAVAVGGTLLFGVILLVLRRSVRRGLATVNHDMSELREAYDRARLDSLLDGLTGLGNHRGFQEELDVRIAQARDDGQPLALVMIDVDDLKTINDERGHAAGDDLLRSVAQIMRANLRRGDGAYRTGGDEFALLLPACNAEAPRSSPTTCSPRR